MKKFTLLLSSLTLTCFLLACKAQAPLAIADDTICVQFGANCTLQKSVLAITGEYHGSRKTQEGTLVLYHALGAELAVCKRGKTLLCQTPPHIPNSKMRMLASALCTILDVKINPEQRARHADKVSVMGQVYTYQDSNCTITLRTEADSD